jgi:DNA-damage-inducible protein D
MLNYFPAAQRDWHFLSVRLAAWERLHARVALRQIEKEFAHAIRNLMYDEEGYGQLKSAGDKVLFGGLSTKAMRERLGLDADHTLSDFLPAVTLRARIEADLHTIHALEENPRRTEEEVAELHRNSNQTARNALLEIWVKPEFLPAEENIHHVETRFRQDLERVIALGLPG